MKYPDVLSKFWKENSNLGLAPSAIAIYTFLINKWIENKREDFVLSDLKLSRELNLSLKTIRVNKKKLQDNKLINYEVTTGYPCTYNFLNEQFNLQKGTSSQKDPEKNIKIKSKSKSATIKRTTNQISSNSIHTEENKIIPINSNVEAPSLEEFFTYAKSLQNYDPEADAKIEKKYNDWLNNGWNNDYNRPIINWKTLLKSMMQFIIDNKSEIISIPKITNPKIVNNE
ncbi:hypothetical protein SD427_18695 (plasmid) [Chryseobacterium sp. JJR-5R]|uniref:hypothetical protein n=1 Tax=Chryseobacterium sp. JJR-5R TaxID=3093923 RepID=UPI002A75DFE4|nr:hypothetical protein [Chryseobacterium sp. JJR-5R]WPO84628.1 hypothetical protein SD427_18695 [Chryseobacterium sp. JJR-5R]